MNAIDQYADKIEYNYDESGVYKNHNLTICIPKLVLHSKLSINNYSMSSIASYQFEQITPTEHIMSRDNGKVSFFAGKVHAKMFKAFTRQNGLDKIYAIQENFRKRNEKQR